MAKANIAILHYTAYPVIGGVENVIADHVRVFADADYRVRVIAGRGEAGQDECAETVVISELDSEYRLNREIAADLEEGHVPRSFFRLQKTIESKLTPQLRSTDVLIVHNVLNFHFNLPLTAALCTLVQTDRAPATIAWCHDVSRFVNPESGAEQRYAFPWDALRTHYPGIRYVAVSADRQSALAAILGIDPGTIRVIPNGVSPEILLSLSELGRYLIREHDIFESDIILLMPIRITRAKNIELALHVIGALKELGLVPRLIVTGPPDPHADTSRAYFQELLAMRSELGLEREAIFLYEGVDGSAPVTVGSQGIAEFYRIADIVLMPSHREGFGLPILEAGLLDRAIFASEIPAVKEMGAEAVHLIEPDESAEHVAARMRAWADENIEHRLRRRVRRDYTWQGIFRREIEPLVAECLRGSRERT